MLVRTFGFTAAGTDNFSDVPAGSYYASALATAKALGIAQAEAGNTFRPTAPVTREDAMVFLYRAMQKAGRGISSAQDSFLTRFPDGAAVSAAARPAVAAMAQAGVIKGGSGGPAQPPGHPHPGRDGRHPPPGASPSEHSEHVEKTAKPLFRHAERPPSSEGGRSVCSAPPIKFCFPP